jgi:aminopeptidase N
MGSNQKSTGVDVVMAGRYPCPRVNRPPGSGAAVCQDVSVTENLTRAEAAERSRLIRVDGYDVDLDLTSGADTFASTTTVAFRAQRPGDSTWIDLIAPEVMSVSLNGSDLDPDDVYDGTRIRLDNVQADNILIVRARCAYMRTGEGVHRFVDPVDNEVYLYTQFESADARRMYACFEQPDLKAPFTLHVRAPQHWVVVSNAPSPDQTTLGDNTCRWDFPATPPISTYITALVAGPYYSVHDVYDGPHGSYPLALFCRASLAEFLDPDDIFLLTKQGFAFFEGEFDVPYPFVKYDQLFVPEFNAGAMENAACVTFTEDMVFRSRVTDAAYEQRANTILHEMAHMWFGDLVTMTWWDDLWLNESFAEWAAHHANVNATRYTDAWTTFSNQRKAWAYRQDQLPSTHPIAADMVDLDAVRVNFDGITYAKGASALRQLVAWVGEDNFRAGINAYFTKHAWGNTELRDLLVELEASSGRDLSGWTTEWLQTSGVNLMRPDISLADDGTYRSVAILQEPPAMPVGVAPTLRSHRMALGLYDFVDGALVRRERIELDVVGARTDVPELIGVRQPDLLLLNDDDLTFTKVRLDDRSWRTAVSHLGDVVESMPRALIWGAAWDMVRDAEVPTGEYVDLVIAGLPRESDIGVVQQTLRQVRTAIDLFATTDHRPLYIARLASALDDLMHSAAPGSDHQLAFVRAFASVASSDADLDAVSGLLHGSVVLDGLAVDTDLRWSFLQRLAATGRAELDAIEAELERDDTATGRRQSAVARAARPSSEAKALAWADMMERTDLPNAILEATIGGFVQPDQVNLLTPYRDRYFAEIAHAWSAQTMEMGQSLVMGLYPSLIVDERTLTDTDAFLAREDLNPALRRLVIEGKDGVRRALLARATDA